MNRRRRYFGGRAAGLTLVELLVVLGIIGVISSVAIPTIARSGWFTSNKSAFAARELFTLLRAAKVYATTYNVDTAVAYGMRVVIDSETGEALRVADQVILARRLKREEINALLELGVSAVNVDLRGTVFTIAVNRTAPLFVPLRGRNGVFRTLPNKTCVMPDLYRVQLAGSRFVSSTGLQAIQLIELPDVFEAGIPPAEQITVVTPRIYDNDPSPNMDINDTLAYALTNDELSFAAHRFKPNGSMDIDDGIPQQRFTIRTGPLPDREFQDRFFVGEEETLKTNELANPEIAFPAIHSEGSVTTNVFTPTTAIVVYPLVTIDGVDVFPDIDTEIELRAATGRIRILD